MTTTFVSGGTGFIGEEVVRRLVREGHHVRVLVRSAQAVEKARALGAEPVPGDLLVAGAWQSAARDAHHVVHLAQPQTFGGRVSGERARRYRDERMRMDRHLLDALDPAKTKRIVYVGGTSYYGDLGLELSGEDATPRPRGWGPFVAPAIEALSGDLARGLPIVTAFPGYVYGDGSWFREYVLAPLMKDIRLNVIGGRSRTGSPIHVDDCASALVHLLARGEVGARYFVVDDRPAAWMEIYEGAARAMGKPFRYRKVHPLLLRLLVGPVVADSVQSDAALSNARLRSLGWEPRFPTIAEGIPDVVKRARPLKKKP
ncbi:MAG: NAD-dependent epimerase/dehydratase family protein [Polyangiaceae bacterium]